MRTKSTAEFIAMAQAVLVSLIESHKVIEPCEIEDNLVAINSLLIDASISSSRELVSTEKNKNPKSAISMLNDIAAQISEGNTLLEVIYNNSKEMSEQTDCALACLIRSFDNTKVDAYRYIEELARFAPSDGDKI